MQTQHDELRQWLRHLYIYADLSPHPIAFLRPDQALCCAASGASKAFWRFYRRLTRQVSSTVAAAALVLLTSQAGGSKAYQKIPLSHSASHFSTSQSGTTGEGQRVSHSRVHSLWTSTLHSQCISMLLDDRERSLQQSGCCTNLDTAASATIGIQHLNLHLRIQLLISSWVEHYSTQAKCGRPSTSKSPCRSAYLAARQNIEQLVQHASSDAYLPSVLAWLHRQRRAITVKSAAIGTVRTVLQ